MHEPRGQSGRCCGNEDVGRLQCDGELGNEQGTAGRGDSEEGYCCTWCQCENVHGDGHSEEGEEECQLLLCDVLHCARVGEAGEDPRAED